MRRMSPCSRGHPVDNPNMATNFYGQALANCEEVPLRTHRFASHSSEEMRRLSNLGHVVEGFVLGGVGVLALASNLTDWATQAWPILILVAGLLLLTLIYPSHPLEDWLAIWRDRQQRQHTLMATALALAGAAEWLRGIGSAWAYVWPGALVFIGALFLIHPQHGTGAGMLRAVWQHRVLGLMAIAAGLLRTGEIVTRFGLFGFLWPLVLLAASVQLIMYREPEGAYETGHGGHT